MKHLVLALATLSTAAIATAGADTPSPSSSATFEKNALPCIAELCIGDGLPEIAKIKWDRAAVPGVVIGGKPAYITNRPLDQYQTKELNQLYRGKVMPAGNYLAGGAFDEKAAPLLQGVTAACRYKDLWGNFTTKSGNPTLVKIALVPSDPKDPASQRWTVVLISQKFPAVKSDVQRADATKQLKERYAKFSNPQRNGPRGRFETTYEPFGSSGFGFYLARVPPARELDILDKHPACGGNEKVSID